jgi:hypothetical protein
VKMLDAKIGELTLESNFQPERRQSGLGRRK